MSQIAGLADARFVARQYRDASKLTTRIGLHQRFSTNPYGWHRWVFDRLEFPPQGWVLELGCGSGELWLENLVRIPAGWQITLSDASAGMLAQARQSLGGRRFRFEVVDAQSIPFASGSFDGVVANHMLYHVPEMDRALAEIRRVLRPGGRLYASTVGQRHLQEIHELVARFDPRLADWGCGPADSFVLENGAARLAPWFAHVTLRRYDDALRVTEPAALIDYILSGRLELADDRRAAFVDFVGREFARCGGEFHVTKDSGIFAAA